MSVREIWSESELRSLVEWLRWFYGEHGPEPRGPQSPERFAHRYGANQLLRVLALEAGRRRDARLASDLIDFADRVGDPLTRSGIFANAYRAVEVLLAHGAPVTKPIQRLAASKAWQARQAVARGLDPATEGALPLLEALAADPEKLVRDAAQEKLAALRELHWWLGTFDHDPLRGLDEAEARSLAEPLGTIRRICDKSYDREQHATDLAAAVRALPDALAAQFLLRFVPTEHRKELVLPLVRDACARQNGAELIWRLIAPGDEHDSDDRQRFLLTPLVQAALLEAAPEHRAQLATDWAGRLLRLGAAEHVVFVQQVCELLSELWPKGADASVPAELLFEWAALAEHDESVADRWALARALTRMVAADPATTALQLWPMVELLRGQHGTLRNDIELLARAIDPDLRRAFAQRLRTHSDDWLRGLALQLALELGDDTPFDELYADPGFRSRVYQHRELRDRVRGRLRAKLARGTLNLDECSTLLEELDDATDDEWAAYRRLQHQCLDEPRWHELRCILVRPPGPWLPEDLELLDRAVELLRTRGREGPDDNAFGLAYQGLICRMAEQPDPAHLDAVHVVMEWSCGVRAALPLFRRQYLKYCKAIGVEPRTFRPLPGAEDWDDDDDFDDDFSDDEDDDDDA